MCRAARHTIAASRTFRFIYDRIEHPVKEYRIIDTWLFARKTNDAMVRNTAFYRNTKICIDDLRRMAMIQTQDCAGTCDRTRFAKSTSRFAEVEHRGFVCPNENNLLFTRSDTSLAFAGRALALKKRFSEAIRRSDNQILPQSLGRLRGLTADQISRLTKRSEKVATRCHLFNAVVHRICQAGMCFQNITFTKITLESVTDDSICIGLRRMTL